MNRRLVALAVVALLTACGGGSTSIPGGEESSASAAAQRPLSLDTRTYENGQLVSRDEADTPAQVFRLYKAAFNRESDPGGLGYHVGHIESVGHQLTDIAGNFVASPEFMSRYGTLTNEAFVIQLYQNVLGRGPDAGGLAFHVGHLSSGTLTRAQTLVGFSESPENKLYTAAAVTAGIRYVPWQPPATGSGNTGVGALASADIVAIPSGASYADSFVATNNGLYMRLFDATGATGLMKLHGNPIFSDAWTPISIGNGGELMTWAPSNTRTEASREVSVYYVTSKPDPNDPFQSIGSLVYSTQNTGGAGYTDTDDRGILRIVGGSGAEAGIFAFRPWAQTAFALYAETGQASGSRTTSDRFRTGVPDPDGKTNIYTGLKELDLPVTSAMIAHPTDPRLFVGDGRTLYEISATGVEATTQLPAASDSFAAISNMAWSNGELFFAYDGKIWRRTTGGSISQFATVDALLGAFGAQEGLFCIQGGELLMRGGTAKSIFWGTERPWLIRPGALTPEQMQKSVYFQALSGVYCTPQGNGVYGVAANNVVFIQPLPY